MRDLKLAAEKISEFQNLDFNNIEIDKIKKILNKIMNGYASGAIQYSEEKTVYRAVKRNTKPLSSKDCSYPPVANKGGRTNRIGYSVFYSSTNWETTLFESRIKMRDKVAISLWKSIKPIILNPIGFAQQYLGFKVGNSQTKFIPPEDIHPILNDDYNLMVDKFLNEIFSTKSDHNPDMIYKITIALSELFLNPTTPFDGIIYPSFLTDNHTYNISLKTHTIDDKFVFQNVGFFELIDRKDDKFNLRLIEVASTVDKNDLFVWRKGKFNSKSDIVKIIY